MHLLASLAIRSPEKNSWHSLWSVGLSPHFHPYARAMPWQAALKGNGDWAAMHKGYQSAIDWPTAGFHRELAKAYPDASFVLTVCRPESWAENFSETIYSLLEGRDNAPPHMHQLIDWGTAVLAKTGFPADLDKPGSQRHCQRILRASLCCRNHRSHPPKNKGPHQRWRPLP